MKQFLHKSFLIAMTTSLPLAASAKVRTPTAPAPIVCHAVADDSKGVAPKIIEMSMHHQDHFITFVGAIDEITFGVIIEKYTLNIHGHIEQPAGVSYNFSGAFAQNSKFEFSAMKGGNIMTPDSLVAVSCVLNK